ncbi:hypothetical protein BHYA_0144g00190 [Botrytis hyacinthi]|uniref:Uncharacterized protein n=1 Tax=Botrytis hyacinthi TaxID=278943 RepID=A0A4Z1GK91_9HELO|nr:hypothetical protein BHYA_0144g00190 [Botrytis hyacinthi]
MGDRALDGHGLPDNDAFARREALLQRLRGSREDGAPRPKKRLSLSQDDGAPKPKKPKIGITAAKSQL